MEPKKGFKCCYCQRWVTTGVSSGTAHRNHCPSCLWSKHLDEKSSGDRQSACGALMAPIGLTFKYEGRDKYTGKPKQGELMVVHQCGGCGKISINRIAADDNPETILAIFEESKNLGKIENINLLTEEDREEIKNQLFGKGR